LLTQAGEVRDLIVSPVDPNLIIIHGSHEVNWKTENCGGDLIAMNNGRPVDEFLFHPFKRDWVLAAAWSTCADFEY
jgi:hypothetical protein